MITRLELVNFIIVEKLTVDFTQGLQILSGETGAGKSIIVGAIDIIFGGDLKPGILLDDKSPATLELTLAYNEKNSQLAFLINEHEIDVSENELFFRREISTDMKAKSFVNGRRISHKVLRGFRDALLDFHSQRDQQKLFDKNYQLEIIDSFGDLDSEREKYREIFRDLIKKIDLWNDLAKQEKENKDKIELYKYQLEELENLELKPAEDSELESELNILNHAEEIINITSSLNSTLYENENSVHDLINSYLFRFTRYENDNDKIKQVVSVLKDALAGIEDAARTSQSILNTISIDQDLLDQTINRLNEINRMKSKYKKDLAGLLDYIQAIRLEIDNYSSQKSMIEDLQRTINDIGAKLRDLAGEISRRRKETAVKLEKEIKNNIKLLAIPDAEILIEFEPVSEKTGRPDLLAGLDENGMDQVNIMFSANKGIKVQPLILTASGGELSRFLLAVKKIISEQLEKRTIVLDEIDSGIGGRTADLLGNFIHEIGKNHQIICITHLAQIASFADRHFAIIKKTDKGLPRINISVLNDEQRKIEIARMVSGKQSEAALKHAEEILRKKENIL